MEDRLFSTVEAARMLGVTRASVHCSVREGRLPAQRIDGRWYITHADVEAYRPRLPPTAGSKRVGPLSESARRALALLDEWGSSRTEELAVVVEVHPGNVRKAMAIAEKLGYVAREDHQWSLTDAGRRWLAEHGQEVAA